MFARFICAPVKVCQKTVDIFSLPFKHIQRYGGTKTVVAALSNFSFLASRISSTACDNEEHFVQNLSLRGNGHSTNLNKSTNKKKTNCKTVEVVDSRVWGDKETLNITDLEDLREQVKRLYWFDQTEENRFHIVMEDGTEIIENDFLMLQPEKTCVVVMCAGGKLVKGAFSEPLHDYFYYEHDCFEPESIQEILAMNSSCLYLLNDYELFRFVQEARWGEINGVPRATVTKCAQVLQMKKKFYKRTENKRANQRLLRKTLETDTNE